MKNTNEFPGRYRLHIAYSHLLASTISSQGLKTSQTSFEATQSSLPSFSDPFLVISRHWHAGIEIWGGGGLASKAREPLEVSGAMLPRKILKNRVSLMPFPASWCGFLCMEQVTNEKKILRILVKQNVNRKIARLLSKNCPIN